jgi:hypothetical protein
MSALRDFRDLYQLYRKHHGIVTSMSRAYHIVFFKGI